MATSKTKTKTAKNSVSDQDEVQAKVDVETDQGFRGANPDPIPNEAYSLETDGLVSPGVAEAALVSATARVGELADLEAATAVDVPTEK